MAIFRVEITAPTRGAGASNEQLVQDLREAGLSGLQTAKPSRLFFLEGKLSTEQVLEVAGQLLVDPVVERLEVVDERAPVVEPDGEAVAVEIHPRPGVMDPVAESTLAELRRSGYGLEAVRTARRYVLSGTIDRGAIERAVARSIANDCIERVVVGSLGVAPAPKPPVYEFKLRHVGLCGLDDHGLEALSRTGHLFLSLEEMRRIQKHYRDAGRDPTDLELETLAQTWSEHCVHKTLKSAYAYTGAAFPRHDGTTVEGEENRRYANLLRDTIARVTHELVAEGRGPECLSVFKDNAGVIGFDREHAIAFKVETHNHPSAIEPYGGAATGIGGVIRDLLGCGLGAKPVASTDIFCVAPADWPMDRLPAGVLHPWRVLRGIVRGVADYGNRMGIPTVNGAVYFDPRYLGNPLVYCGNVGLIPRNMIEKQARAGDRIVVIGGRTGRDGIHGATFSSAELTDTHADEFSHAVQIGNAITEKRVLDALLQARDAAGGCLYTAITDCGAGGLSSAVGEMAAEVGGVVELERVTLKYAGLRYDEIWISEAQERMVLTVPADRLDRFMQIMKAEEVEATDVGVFGRPDGSAYVSKPRLIVRYNNMIVGDLDLDFLHNGVPMGEKTAEWRPSAAPSPRFTPQAVSAAEIDRLPRELARPNVASKAWIVRQYDHEVQGGSVVKPLLGRGEGPGDGAVICPRLGSPRGVALGCGLTPELSEIDPYWMAAAAIDEAMRNVVAVGADPRRVALLDNFCWGRVDDRWNCGALVRACQACYDIAKIYGTPFVSGKDSLNNEFALDAADVEPLIATLEAMARGGDPDAMRLRIWLPEVAARIRARRRLAIPHTLLISAMGLLADVGRACTSDLKCAGNAILLVGGLEPVGFDPRAALAVHETVAALIEHGVARAVHDVSDGGWLTALAEMAIAGERGAELAGGITPIGPFDACVAGYVIEVGSERAAATMADARGVRGVRIASVSARASLAAAGRAIDVARLATAWSKTPHTRG